MHADKIKLAKDADLSRVARGTPGFSGADLANLLNEAALLAARGNKRAVGHIDLEEARDKVLWGRERRSRALEDRERRITAWHESGHALLQVLCEHTEPLHKVTIIPRGQALGATMSLPERDVLNRTKRELLDQLVVLMGGRIAEEIFTGDFSTGARMDIKMASEIARKMVCSFGMSETFGFQSFGDNQETFFLGREVARSQSYSEATARQIDAEVQRIVTEAYERATKLLSENRTRLEQLVESLIEAETMDGRIVEELIREGRILTPKERAQREAKPPADSATTEVETQESEAPCAVDTELAHNSAQEESKPVDGDLTVADPQPPPLPK